MTLHFRCLLSKCRPVVLSILTASLNLLSFICARIRCFVGNSLKSLRIGLILIPPNLLGQARPVRALSGGQLQSVAIAPPAISWCSPAAVRSMASIARRGQPNCGPIIFFPCSNRRLKLIRVRNIERHFRPQPSPLRHQIRAWPGLRTIRLRAVRPLCIPRRWCFPAPVITRACDQIGVPNVPSCFFAHPPPRIAAGRFSR